MMYAPAAPAVSTPANLALGPTAEHGRIAEYFTQRSTWPSVPVGYRLDDAAYHVEVIYDDQSFYDRLGGGYFRMSETARTSTMLR